eukprot:Skav232299  [mRNA]  locus=scaffold882:441077:441703:+ [translate_table: standard]
MAVPSDQQIQSHVGQGFVETLLMATGEMRHSNLPGGLALGQQPSGPLLLLCPQCSKPPWAAVDRGWPISGCASCARLVVLAGAHVVVWILLRRLSIHKVGIQEVIVHVKAQICIDHGGLVVWCWHHPSVREPGVGHLLVPTVVELEASPVVIAQDAKPGLVAESSSLIHTLENLIELMLGGVRDLVHGLTAGLFNATPIEVVAHVQDV